MPLKRMTPSGIEQQDRRLLDAQPALERIERRLVDILEPVGAIDRVRQLKADGKRGRCGGQKCHVVCLIAAYRRQMQVP